MHNRGWKFVVCVYVCVCKYVVVVVVVVVVWVGVGVCVCASMNLHTCGILCLGSRVSAVTYVCMHRYVCIEVLPGTHVC